MKRITFIVALAASLITATHAAELAGLSALEVEDGYRAFLSAMPLQLENGGAKIFKLQDGSLWLVSIGSTIVKPASSSEALRRRTVAKAKAQANAVAELNGTDVKTTTVMTTSDKITTQNGVETGTSQETLNETIVTAVKGVIKELPIVGSWINKEQTMFYITIGKRLK